MALALTMIRLVLQAIRNPEVFDENMPYDDPPPNSQPYRNLGLSPTVLQRIYLPPQDPSLGVSALRHSSTPWELGLTPRSRMWIDEFGYDLGKFGLYFPIIVTLVGVRAVCGIEQKERQRVRHTFSNLASLNHKERRLPGLVSQCVLPTSVVRHALSIAVLMVDLMPCLRLGLRRNLQLLPNSLRKSLSKEAHPTMRNPAVMTFLLGLIYRMSKLVFRRRKGAPKLLRFILGMRELFQEPMDLVQTPMVLEYFPS